MAIDARQLGTTQVCRLLNSTPLGPVISERQLHRHRTRAGYRIGDGRHVDLYRYLAWMVTERHAAKTEPDGITGYDAMKKQARARNALLSLSGRDIGELPAVGNPEHLHRRIELAQLAVGFLCPCAEAIWIDSPSKPYEFSRRGKYRLNPDVNPAQESSQDGAQSMIRCGTPANCLVFSATVALDNASISRR